MAITMPETSAVDRPAVKIVKRILIFLSVVFCAQKSYYLHNEFADIKNIKS